MFSDSTQPASLSPSQKLHPDLAADTEVPGESLVRGAVEKKLSTGTVVAIAPAAPARYLAWISRSFGRYSQATSCDPLSERWIRQGLAADHDRLLKRRILEPKRGPVDIPDYIERFYDRRRRHSAIGDVSPVRESDEDQLGLTPT